MKPSYYKQHTTSKSVFQISIFLFIMLFFSCIKSNSESSESQLAVLPLILDSSKLGTSSLDGSCETTTENNYLVTIVKATSYDSWTHCDLKSKGVKVSSMGDWDVRFQRFKIGTNSGTSNSSGNGGSCKTNSNNFSISFTSSSCIFVQDKNLSQDGGGSGGNGTVTWSGSEALFDWYSYKNTILTAKSDVYLVRSSNGSRYFKIQILDYYSSSGTPAYIKFKWMEIQ